MNIKELLSRVDRLITLLESQQCNNNKYLNLKEAAAYLKLSESSVYKMTSENRIIHLKPEGKLYFRQSDLDAWLEKKQVASLDELEQDYFNNSFNSSSYNKM